MFLREVSNCLLLCPVDFLTKSLCFFSKRPRCVDEVAVSGVDMASDIVRSGDAGR